MRRKNCKVRTKNSRFNPERSMAGRQINFPGLLLIFLPLKLEQASFRNK